MRQNWPNNNPNFMQLGAVEDNIIEISGNSNLQEEFFNFSLKFKESSYLITDYILEVSDISKLDNYFFSLAYLYRHSLELILKAIGFKYIILLEDRKLFVKETFHNLSRILEFISPNIESCIKKNKDAYDWLVLLFEDMNQIDKESDSFRYPFGISVKKGEAFLDTPKQFTINMFIEKQTHIDLVAFANKMEVAFDILKSYYFDDARITTEYLEFKPKLLEVGGSYYDQSVLGYSYSRNKFYSYVKAYTESADFLYEKICRNIHLKETLFIPMCYLYRNGVELVMKEILFEECSYEFQKAMQLLKNNKHNLSKLWNSIKFDVIKLASVSENDSTIINFEKYIKQLHEIDSSSDKFRYPTNKHLSLHFKRKIKLDIRNVAMFFKDITTFLSGVGMMMSAQNEWKAEMQAEYTSYFDSSDYL
ncbi:MULTISPECIES: hypothetical protein [Bacillus amyloliquefaciens group]|uniref:hypothetical protein n=1 Tax=Bacillus amyloliquefaciens group TaxID=1938374 RepID=UPI000B516353|nr:MULTISPECIES: hypothetical protein [Bacillus amyloliquefaciens group]ASF30712.1 hypothetical protein WV34_18880 [Bacillus amyloliquefaciens]MDQ8093271.1 hypothetical protein [Bacillus amyloliquefaciens]